MGIFVHLGKGQALKDLMCAAAFSAGYLKIFQDDVTWDMLLLSLSLSFFTGNCEKCMSSFFSKYKFLAFS